MKLKLVNIVDDRYFHDFRMDSDKTIVAVATTKESIDSLTISASIMPTLSKATYVWSAAKIGFDTPTGELSDSQYATQVNGFHWVKIPGYAVIKINPEFIKNNILSPAGEADIIERSVAE